MSISIACCAEDITIRPQYIIGDTLKYRSTASVTVYHEKDSMLSTIKMLPKLVVERQNDKGFVIRTFNQVESFDFYCSDPETKGLLPEKKEELNEIASISLQIQLDADCHPDTILNMEEIEKTKLKTYIKTLSEKGGKDIENTAEWENVTKPLLVHIIKMQCQTKHLVKEQFGNTPYFALNGIPLKSGKISSSVIFTDGFLQKEPGMQKLKIEIEQTDNKELPNEGKDTGTYVVSLHGKSDKTTVEGTFNYNNGILSHGYLQLKTEMFDGKITSTSILDKIN